MVECSTVLTTLMLEGKHNTIWLPQNSFLWAPQGASTSKSEPEKRANTNSGPKKAILSDSETHALERVAVQSPIWFVSSDSHTEGTLVVNSYTQI